MINITMHRKVIEIVGFWQWITLVLCFDEIRDYFARIYYCHHNARVLADMEYRFGCVLCECTRGMSKAYYTTEAMIAEINDMQNELYEEAYAEGCKDTKLEYEHKIEDHAQQRMIDAEKFDVA